MRVCYWGTYDAEHVRNQVMIAALERLGAEVITLQETIWPSTEARVADAKRGLAQPSLWWRMVRTYVRLAWRYLHAPRHDVMVVGYPGHFDLMLGRVLSWMRGVPLVWDALVSLYETVVEDRALIAPSSLAARCLERLERLLWHLPDRIVLDTQANITFFARRYGVNLERFMRLWVGAPESVCRPVKEASRDPFRVVYFGKFIPLHGLEQVLRAAYLLREHPAIRFELIGYGQTWSAMRALAEEWHLEHVSFNPHWFPLQDLVDHVAGAGACLGVFGTSPKAMRVIPTKAFIALALGLPLVTIDSPGARELLTHEENALLCKPGDPEDLAACLLRLYEDPALAKRLARQGQALYWEQCTPKALAQAWSVLLQGVQGPRS